MTRNILIRRYIVALSGTLSFDFGTPVFRYRSRLLAPAPAQPKRVSSNPNRPRHPQRTSVKILSLLADVAPNEVPDIDAAVVPQHEQMRLSRITVPAGGYQNRTSVSPYALTKKGRGAVEKETKLVGRCTTHTLSFWKTICAL